MTSSIVIARARKLYLKKKRCSFRRKPRRKYTMEERRSRYRRLEKKFPDMRGHANAPYCSASLREMLCDHRTLVDPAMLWPNNRRRVLALLSDPELPLPQILIETADRLVRSGTLYIRTSSQCRTLQAYLWEIQENPLYGLCVLEFPNLHQIMQVLYLVTSIYARQHRCAAIDLRDLTAWILADLLQELDGHPQRKEWMAAMRSLPDQLHTLARGASILAWVPPPLPDGLLHDEVRDLEFMVPRLLEPHASVKSLQRMVNVLAYWVMEKRRKTGNDQDAALATLCYLHGIYDRLLA